MGTNSHALEQLISKQHTKKNHVPLFKMSPLTERGQQLVDGIRQEHQRKNYEEEEFRNGTDVCFEKSLMADFNDTTRQRRNTLEMFQDPFGLKKEQPKKPNLLIIEEETKALCDAVEKSKERRKYLLRSRTVGGSRNRKTSVDQSGLKPPVVKKKIIPQPKKIISRIVPPSRIKTPNKVTFNRRRHVSSKISTISHKLPSPKIRRQKQEN